jgi:O-antigen ligase
MDKSLQRAIVSNLGVIAAVGVGLFISPNYSAEPIDQSKLFVLVLVASLLTGFLLNSPRIFILKKFVIPNVILGLLALDLFLVMLFSGAELHQQFFGANGRNTGFLAYASLILIFVGIMHISDEKNIKKFSIALLVTGVISMFYGYLQFWKHDPIKWNNPYNAIIAFLGNPDFSSSFLGMSAIVGVAIFFGKNTKNRTRFFILGYVVLNFFLVKATHAQQGVIVLGICSALILLIFLAKNSNIKKQITYGYSVFASLLGIVVILGIFKIGPLASNLYKVSVRQRGFYWHAALKMMAHNPLVGVGLDSYGDNYFKYRSANAAFYTMQTQSNAAHNVFLDFASSGGIPCAILYLALTGFIFWQGVRTLRKLDSFNVYFVAIFSAWIGYQAQSIVSINNLGLAIWGWTLGALIVGYSINQEKKEEPVKRSGSGRRVNSKTISKVNYLAPAISLFAGLILIYPNFAADHDFRVATQSRNASIVVAATSKYPEDLNRTLNAAQLLAASKLNDQALALARHVAEKNPKNYNAWNIIAQLTPAQSSLHLQAVTRMRLLNPQDKSIQ